MAGSGTLTTILQEPAFTATLIGEKHSTSLLDLPPEVRLEIYQHLFGSSKLSCGTPHATYPPCGYSTCTCLFPYQITNVNRQLRRETLSMLLGATTIEVAGRFDRIVRMPAPYLESFETAVVLDAKMFSLRPFQLEQLPNLKVLELRNITVWCKYYDEVYLESAAADQTMYGLAIFNLQRIGRNLRDLCDGSRAFAVRLCCQFVVNSLSDETIHAVVDVDTMKIIHKSRGPPMKNFNSWSGFY